MHNIFAAGDLIDVRRPPSEVAEFLRTQLDRLATISFRYIQGQHELSSPPWLSAISDNVQHLDGREPVNVYGTSGMSLIGIDWQPADKLAEKLEAIPDDVDILMAHQVWEDFMGDNVVCEGSFDQVPTKTMFTGDYHKFMDVELTGSKMQKLRVISPGATNIRAMGESSHKYYMLLDDEGCWHKKRIPTRPYGEMDVFDESDLEALAKDWPRKFVNLQKASKERIQLTSHRDLPDDLLKPIYRIIHPDHLSVKKAVQQAIGKDAFIFYKRTRTETEEKKQRRIDRRVVLDRGVNGCLPLAISREDKRFKPLARLLNSPNPKLELQTMKQEVFGDIVEVRET